MSPREYNTLPLSDDQLHSIDAWWRVARNQKLALARTKISRPPKGTAQAPCPTGLASRKPMRM